MNLPNALTIARILLVPVIGFLVYTAVITGNIAYTWVAMVTFVIAALTDWADGFAARKMGLVTPFGALWDPIADKALVLGTLAILAYVNEVEWLIVLLFAFREIGMTLWRMAIVREGGEVVSARPWGKGKTATQLVGITLLLTPAVYAEYGLILIYIALLLAYISAGDLLWAYYRNKAKAAVASTGEMGEKDPDPAA